MTDSGLPLVLDLFSGTGSGTRPFEDCGKHRVVHIDIAPPAEIRCDVRKLPGWLLKERPEFTWASPPCTEFSQLTFLRVYHPGGRPPEPERGMELVRAAFKIACKARWWCVENVRRSEQFIGAEFGSANVRKDAWCLWTNLDSLLFSQSNTWRKGYAARAKPTPSGLPRTSGVDRARIPRQLAEAVHRAVCEP